MPESCDPKLGHGTASTCSSLGCCVAVAVVAAAVAVGADGVVDVVAVVVEDVIGDGVETTVKKDVVEPYWPDGVEPW